MLILKIVTRNIFAHARKNLIICAVTACVSLFLFLFLSFSDGEMENVKNGVSGFFMPPADIYVTHTEFRSLLARNDDKKLRDATVHNAEELKTLFAGVQGVREVITKTARIGTNLYFDGEKYLDFGLLGVDPDDTLIRAKYSVLSGDGTSAAPDSLGWMTPADAAHSPHTTDVPDTTDVPPILLHESVRSSIPVKTGDILTLVATDLFGQISTARVRLAGFFEPVQDNVNLYSLVLMPSDPYARFAGYNPGETNRLIIRLEKWYKPERVAPDLHTRAQEAGYDLDVYPQSEDSGTDMWLKVFSMIRLIIIATSLITLFITAFGIMNVTSTNLADRKKEIGTYYCLGSEPPFLMAVYTLEIFIVNLAGSLAGIGTGLIVRAGINALKITSDNPGFLIVAGGSTFTLGLSAGTILWIIGGISLLTVLTALTTLGKALNVSPVVAVKETEQ